MTKLIPEMIEPVTETLFAELKRYVGFDAADEALLAAFRPTVRAHFDRIVDVFYARIHLHDGARAVLVRGERVEGQLRVTLRQWLVELFDGPWDESYYERRARIGRVHVKIAMPQHYMFGAMNTLRGELVPLCPDMRTTVALERLLDIELAVMLHTYREDMLSQAQRAERLAVQAEKLELARRAQVAEKLAAVGTMTAGLSHEIRNPLNAASLQLQVLERRLRRLPGDVQGPALEPLTLVRDEIRRLDHILEDFLQFARPIPLNASKLLSLNGLLSKVTTFMQEQVRRKQVRVVVDTAGELTVPGDEERLRQVFLNLLLNALEATPEGGEIRIACTQNERHCVLTIDDTGPGVPSELRERIFEPFFTTRAKGSGLGLPICHAIITQHSGELKVDSNPRGGARFVVTLPKA